MSASFDLFGREVFDAIRSDTLPLFHEPVEIAPPGRSGADAAISSQYHDVQATAALPFDENTIREYEV